MGIGEVEFWAGAPCLLEVAGGKVINEGCSLLAGEVPDAIDSEVFGGRFFEVGVGGSEDVQGAWGDVAGFDDAHQFNSGEGVLLAGDGDDGVAHCEEGEIGGKKPEEGGGGRSKGGGHADGFFEGVDQCSLGGAVNGPFEFVSPGGIVHHKIN